MDPRPSKKQQRPLKLHRIDEFEMPRLPDLPKKGHKILLDFVASKKGAIFVNDPDVLGQRDDHHPVL